MLRSTLSLWFGLTNAMLIISTLPHNVEMQFSKLHMGILETRNLDVILKEMKKVQKTGSSPEDKLKSFERLLRSYTLSELRHLLLTEEFLYDSDSKKFEFITDYNHLMFDSEAISILKTVQIVPFHDAAFENIQWTLLFYVDKVNRLMEAFLKGELANPSNDQFMYKIHQYIVDSLLRFLTHNMEQFKGIEEKLKQINVENMFNKVELTKTIFENKNLLDTQMSINEMYKVSIGDVKPETFAFSITILNELAKIRMIVVEYFGELYWTIVERAWHEMYDFAMNVINTISYRITCLWHTKNGIVKVIKLILIKFVERYLERAPVMENVEGIKSQDIFMTQKLSTFCEYVGESSNADRLTQMFNGRFSSSPDFYVAVKKAINFEKTFYPVSIDFVPKDYISRYYTILVDESSTTKFTQTKNWTDIDGFLRKVKDLFSAVNMKIANSFDLYFFDAESFKRLKDIEHPKGVEIIVNLSI